MTIFPSDLPTAARFVLVTMRAIANGSLVTIGRSEIAENTGQSVMTVDRALKVLLERGMLSVEKTPKGSYPGRAPRTYRIID